MADRVLNQHDGTVPRASARQREQGLRLRYFDWLGIAARLWVYGLMFYLTWQWLPSSSDPIFDRPLSSLSLNDLGRLSSPFFVFIFLLQSFCQPGQDAERRKIWSWVGVYLIIGGIVAAVVAAGSYLLKVPMTLS